MPKEFKSAYLFLQLGLPPTLIRYENAALVLQLGLSSSLIRRKRSSDWRNLTFSFCVDEKWRRSFLKTITSR